MSSVQRSSLLPATVSTPQLRRILEQALPGDAEVDAFCIDYVPVVYRQYSSGMERTRKLNLLLAGTAPSELLELLHSYAPEIVSREIASLVPLPLLGVRRWRDAGRSIGLGTLATAAIGFIAIAFEPLVKIYRTSSGSIVSRQESPAPSSPDTNAGTEGPRLTSEPSPAMIYAVPSGRYLGQTPWTPERVPNEKGTGAVQVCLRSPGFMPTLVKLEPLAEPPRSRSIHVRLQEALRSLRLLAPNQEACHVQTTIIE